MYSTKSFCHIDTFVSNTPGINNTLGEITPFVLTFSREVGTYANATYPNLTLYTLFSKEGSGATATSQTMSIDMVDKCLAMANHVVVYMASAVGEIFQDVLQQQLSDFGATIGAVNVLVGTVNQHNTRWGPDFISFRSDLDPDEEHTIWFSTPAIAAQYTEYEIVVVPPFEPLDNFFTTPGNVYNLLNADTQQETFERINTAINGKPPTLITSRSFDYYNPQNTSQTYETKWVYLIYGPAGDNIDSIKDASVNYILENSSHVRDDWLAILPDIFKRTEFIIAPFWNQYAVEPMTLSPQGVRSPIASLDQIVQQTMDAAPEYQEAHVRQYVTVTSFNYTSIGAAIIGNVENRLGLFDIRQFYPDYFITPTTSIDFNRMEQNTQDWVIHINNMLSHAENMTAVSSVPPGYNRVIRGNTVYVSKTIDNVAYLVAAKKVLVAPEL